MADDATAVRSGPLPVDTPIEDMLTDDAAKSLLTPQATKLTKADLLALNTTGADHKEPEDLDLGYEDIKSVADAFTADFKPTPPGLKAQSSGDLCCCCTPCCCCTAVAVTDSIVTIA